ncbi:MAG TPA: ABC transporter permease [Mycobacteriales bacterium]|nr:ABC transporter permease [Mycobacteriales bacterium]
MTETQLADRPTEAPVPTTTRSTALPSALRHGLTLAWRNLMKLKHSPEQFIDVTLQPIIFILLFVFVFGGAVSSSWHDYLPFVLPGILAQTIVFATMTTGTNLNTDITKGIFDRFRSLPIARSAPLIGSILGDIGRFVVTIVVVLGFGSALGFRIKTDPGQAIAACLLIIGFAVAVCWITVFIGLLAKTPGMVTGLSLIFMFPLTFGSNVFTEASTMPGWLQAWVKVNPITGLTDSVRGLMLGGPVATPVWHTIAWAFGIVAVFAPLALRAYRRRA